jgi:type VI protein secretion system component Hcp
MEDNKATPKLMIAYLNKTAIKTATFYAQKSTGTSGGSDYLIVTMSDVRITSFFHGSNEDYNKPVVEGTMSFSKIQMIYKEGSKEVAKAGWDFKTNKPI